VTECSCSQHAAAPSETATAAGNPVVSGDQARARRRPASGFDYLLKTAQRESALEPDAKARNLERDRAVPVHRADLAVDGASQEGPKQGLGDLRRRDQRGRRTAG
jgi:hypothetical protein